MPDFTSSISSLSFNKKLSHQELARAIRFSIAAEYEAIQIYEQIVESIDEDRYRKIIMDIIKEEKVHAGQFMQLLFEIEPEESRAYAEGEQENKEIHQGKK